MVGRETSLGGGAEAFPSTPWSTILSLPQGTPGRTERLNDLCHLYWKPVYSFIRKAWGKSIEDSKDLAQAFFFRILEGNSISNYQPTQGRFRHFLKGALRHFLANDYRDSLRLKRGGGKAILSLDATDMETARFVADLDQYSAEELFDIQWAREVISQTLTQLRSSLLQEGKEKYFQVYEAYELSGSATDRPTYLQIAQRLDLSKDDVKNFLTYTRARIQSLIEGKVGEYVASREDVAAEIDELFPR